MSIEVTYDEERAEAVVIPTYGGRVVFVVERRKVNVAGRNAWAKRVATRWVVGLKGSSGDGFTWHTSYTVACKSLISRARRYDQAYAVPRGKAAVAS